MNDYVYDSGCNNCENSLPEGCLHIYGDQLGCKIGPSSDPNFLSGKAIINILRDYRGFRNVLDNFKYAELAELAIDLGKAARSPQMTNLEEILKPLRDAADLTCSVMSELYVQRQEKSERIKYLTDENSRLIAELDAALLEVNSRDPSYRDQLERKLAAAEKDTRRMNWLDDDTWWDFCRAANPASPMDTFHLDVREGLNNNEVYSRASARQVIDAAIDAALGAPAQEKENAK